ncbi:MAG: hypothetical protein ABMB14_24905 [Myxococcota bacterium]
MRSSFTRLALALTVAFGLGSTPALARPIVRVSVGVPAVVVAPAPRPVVVYRPACPGPNFVWVEGGYRRDAWGRAVFVGGHWAPRQPVVVHQVRGPRTVIVRR